MVTTLTERFLVPILVDPGLRPAHQALVNQEGDHVAGPADDPEVIDDGDAEAGFGDVTVQTLPHDPLNYYYVAKPTQ